MSQDSDVSLLQRELIRVRKSTLRLFIATDREQNKEYRYIDPHELRLMVKQRDAAVKYMQSIVERIEFYQSDAQYTVHKSHLNKLLNGKQP